MKIRVNTGNLQTAVNKAIGTLPKRTTMDVLNNYKISTTENGINIVANNTVTAVIVNCEAEVDEVGKEFLIDGKRFSAFVSSFSSKTDDLEFTLKDGETELTMKYGKSKTKFAVLPVENYPDLPKLDDNAFTIKFGQTPLKKAILNTIFAIDEKDIAHQLDCVNLNNLEDKDKMTVLSMSGALVALRTVPIEANDTFSIALPLSSVVELKKMLTDKEEDKVTVIVDKHDIRCEFENTTFYIRLLDRKFPLDMVKKLKNLATTLPEKTEIKVDREESIEVLKRCKLMGSNIGGNVVVISAKTDTLYYQRVSEYGNVDEHLPIEKKDINADNEKKLMKKGFNIDFLMEIFSNIEDETISIVSDYAANTPIVCQSEDYTYVLVPCLIPVDFGNTFKEEEIA